MSKIVYRHYKSPEEFEAYMQGKWSGPGTHGRLDLSLEEDVVCALSSASGQMQLRGRPSQRGSFFARLRLALSRQRRARRASVSFEERIPMREAQCGADLAEISTDRHRVVVQAMTEKRMHLLFEKKGNPPVLEFSGVLSKR